MLGYGAEAQRRQEIWGLLCNLTSWDSSVLTQVVAEHVHHLFRDGSFLVSPKVPSKKMLAALSSYSSGQGCLCSTSCKLKSGATVTCGNVAFFISETAPASFPFQAGQIHCILQLQCGDMALVENLRFEEVILSLSVSKWIAR